MAEHLALPAADRPSATVVVLATRRADRLHRCLSAIAATHEPDLAVQVVICCNAADDDVRALVASTSGAVVMTSNVNLGTAATWNRAIERVAAPHVAIVHEDARPQPGWLGALRGACTADASVAVAGARILDPNGSVESQGWVTWEDGVVWPLAPSVAPGLELPADVHSIDSVSSATMLIDRAHWETVDGFDEGTFPAVGVEHDFCATAWAAGRRVIAVPAATSVHETGAMLDAGAGPMASLAFREFLIGASHERFGRRWSALLATRLPRPPREPAPDAIAEALSLAMAREVAPIDLPVPKRDRSLTGGAPADDQAPAEVEARARDGMAARREEFATWLIEERARLRGRYEAEVSAAAEARTRADERAATIDALQAELEAMRATFTWRAHTAAFHGRFFGRISAAAMRVVRVSDRRGDGPGPAR